MSLDAVIVGGGLGGLIAGAQLASQGKKVTLLEQHYVVGGCATTFKRGKFTVEVGLHEIDGLDDEDIKRPIFENLDIYKNIEFITPDSFYKTVRGDDIFVLPHGREAALNAFLHKFPDDEKAIRKYFKFIYKMHSEIRALPDESWKLLLMLPILPFKFPTLLLNLRTSVLTFLNRVTDNEDLKIAILSNLQYYHDDPTDMSLLYYAAAQASYYTGGGHYIKGGSQKLSDYLANYITSHGGLVITKALVTKINTDRDGATGVEYYLKNDKDNSRTIDAKTVIFNGSVPSAVDMVDLEPLDDKDKINSFKERVSNCEIGPSILTLYLGFNINLKELGNDNYSTFIIDKSLKSSNDFKSSYNDIIEKKGLVFVDYGQIDAGLTPDGYTLGSVCCADNIDDWEGLSNDDYKAKKERYTEVIINRLEKFYPGISNHIEYKELATAKTIKRYTLNPNGAVYGFAQTTTQAGPLRVQHTSPLKNLFFASVWTTPGGGFTGAIMAGHKCYQKVLKQLNKKSK